MGRGRGSEAGAVARRGVAPAAAAAVRALGPLEVDVGVAVAAGGGDVGRGSVVHVGEGHGGHGAVHVFGAVFVLFVVGRERGVRAAPPASADRTRDAGEDAAAVIVVVMRLVFVVVGETGHAQRRVSAPGGNTLQVGWRRRGRAGCCRVGTHTRHCAPSSQTIPLVLWHRTVFWDRVHGFQPLLLLQPPELLLLHLLSHGREASHEGGGTANGVRLGLRLGLLLLSNGLDLVEIALKHRSIWNILGRLGKLEKNDTRTNGKEPQDDRNDLLDSALETLKENSRSDDGGAGEIDVVRRRDKSGIEDIEGFL